MAVLGLRFCARAFSSCGKRGPLFIAVRGPLFIAVRGPLTIAAPPVAGHKLQTRRLSNCGSRAQPLRGMWDLPRPGLEPVCPALAGRLSTTAPPGKPRGLLFNPSGVVGVTKICLGPRVALSCSTRSECSFLYPLWRCGGLCEPALRWSLRTTESFLKAQMWKFFSSCLHRA